MARHISVVLVARHVAVVQSDKNQIVPDAFQKHIVGYHHGNRTFVVDGEEILKLMRR